MLRTCNANKMVNKVVGEVNVESPRIRVLIRQIFIVAFAEQGANDKIFILKVSRGRIGIVNFSYLIIYIRI